VDATLLLPEPVMLDAGSEGAMAPATN